MNSLKDLYKSGWKNLIKPMRYDYDDYQIGFENQNIDQIEINRIEFEIIYNNNKVKSTIFKIDNDINNTCVIYLNSMSGNKLEGSHYSEYILPYLNFCVFDYIGTGKSDGKYITMGIHEKEQLRILIERLKSEFDIKYFFLWGRSMGAVTIIQYIKNYYNINDDFIKGIILDSPFKSLKSSIKDTMKNLNGIPKFLTNLFLIPINKKCKTKTGVNIMNNKPSKMIYNFNISSLFIVGKNDQITTEKKVRDIYNRYGINNNFNDKSIITFDGEHSSERDNEVIEKIIKFINNNFDKYKIKEHLNIEEIKENTIKLDDNIKIFENEIKINSDNIEDDNILKSNTIEIKIK